MSALGLFPVDLVLVSSEIPRLVNFTIFVAVLIYLLRKPASQFLKSRAEQILQALNQAARERETAKTKLREIESRLNRLSDEIEQIKANAAKEAAAQQERIKASTDMEIEKLRAFAEREIQSAMNAARQELKAFAATQAVEMARHLIQRNITDDDHHRLIKQFSQQLNEVQR
ncbi:MAG: ATP synthase F0 subunit B [Acidobacteriota bacterium]|nr:ATP synthase F0 subunit B [Blastocatellia bacterium]MDW8241198.1 ATP synthase F0 subunit B [Acidobacteriota bacterium]